MKTESKSELVTSAGIPHLSWIPLLSTLLFLYPLPAASHGGINSIGGLVYLFYLLLAFPAIGLAVLAYVLKRKTQKLNFISMAIMLVLFGYVAIGVFGMSNPFFWGALNPWLNNDSALLSICCLLLLVIIGNYFIDSLKVQLSIVCLLIAVVVLQAFLTPGARIYYPNNPLSGESVELTQYDKQYAGLPDGRVIFFEKGMRGSRGKKSLNITLEPIGAEADAFKIVASHTRSSGDKGADRFLAGPFRNPFRVMNFKREYGVAKILPDDWKATDHMLYTATAGYNYKMDWIRELLKRGASPNYSVELGYNSLKNAVGQHDLELLGLLLAHGGNINLKSAGGNTPLHRAVHLNIGNEGAYTMIKFLLENGADADMENDKGETPRSIVVEKYNTAHETSAGYKILKKIIPLFDSY